MVLRKLAPTQHPFLGFTLRVINCPVEYVRDRLIRASRQGGVSGKWVKPLPVSTRVTPKLAQRSSLNYALGVRKCLKTLA